MHPDPAGLAAVDPSNPQSWNRYAYVLNNPLRLVDPQGLWPANTVGEWEPPHYLIAFAPPDYPEGICHHIRVKVNRPNAWVLAREEYCVSTHSASDPLNGTTLGKQMESALASTKPTNVDTSLSAIAFYGGDAGARVHVSLDWSWKSLNHNSRTIGVIGLVFRRGGSLLTRFSDLFESVEDHGVYGGLIGAPP